ncbi:MAG: hypothetical protein WKF73_11910 [Nocardioidaceae bacterium]
MMKDHDADVPHRREVIAALFQDATKAIMAERRDDVGALIEIVEATGYCSRCFAQELVAIAARLGSGTTPRLPQSSL